MNLSDEYKRVCKVPSDINQHCSLLCGIASIYGHITEFGVRYGNSTIAFLAGLPKKLVSYDLVCLIDVPAFQAMAPEIDFRFEQGNSLEIEIENTDVLFIDTLHTGTQLYAELKRHHRAVRAHIILHDTTTFGETGEDGQPGLNFAITKFLGRHVEWRQSNYYAKNNGLTILTRQGFSSPEKD